MNECALILTDLYLAPEAAGAGGDSASGAWPRLPLLEQWLARADRLPLEQGWRRWLAADLGCPQSLAVDASSSHWYATPVHWVAGLDTLRLHPQGLIDVGAEAQCRLVADFGRVFADTGWTLASTPGRELLLTLRPDLERAPPDAATPRSTAIGTQDPARWLGQDPKAGLPRGPGAASLRRLMVEMEMWLHTHEVNAERTAAGQLPVTALWLWGGDLAAPAFVRAAPPGGGDGRSASAGTLYATRESFIHQLAAETGATLLPLPARMPERMPERVPGAGGSGAARFILSVCSYGLGQSFAQLEPLWLQPLLSQLAGGRWHSVALVANDALWRLRPAHRWRRWRRLRPWWQAMAAC